MCWIFFLLITDVVFGIDVKLEERIAISQDEAILMSVQCFAVTEDEILILPDAKEGDIKLYNNKGTLLKRWGRRGPGPEEFGSPWDCDYKEPYYLHLDPEKSMISIFKRTETLKFDRLHEIRCIGCMSDVKIFNDGVMIDGYAIDSNGKEYSLYFKDFEGKKTKYILPRYLKYGFESENISKIRLNDISPLGVFSYFSVYDHYIFYAWEGRLKILKIDLETNKVDSFGQETKYYARPKVTKGILEARMKRKGEIESKEKENMSWIRGVFANDDFIVLYYVNYNKQSSFWEAFLQFYDHSGNFFYEKRLPDAISYLRNGPPFYYHQAKNRIYFLSLKLNTIGFLDEYEVLKYKIDK